MKTTRQLLTLLLAVSVAGKEDAPISCDFDAPSLCHFTNSQEDDFDWKLNSGSTCSDKTGPDADHTKGDEAGYYIFIDASGRKQYDKARLDSTVVSWPSDKGSCITFWYNMNGADVGSLYVFVSENSALGGMEWLGTTNSGNRWLLGRARGPGGPTLMVSFVASVGNGPLGNIAIDDIIVTEGNCE